MYITAPDITINATVGKSYLSIYGYGPINSEVLLRGNGVSERTFSDKTGLFRFGSVYNFTYTYPELCIQSVDDQKRTTQPTCIPSLPLDSSVPFEVGPILLSPTLSLSKNRVTKNENTYLSGKTTPNTNVNIYMGKSKNKQSLSFVSTVNAYNLPVVNLTSNENGEFDINVPTSDVAEYNIFASTKFDDNFSAKSNTLKFVVISTTKSIFNRMWNFLIQNKIMLFIVAEVLIFILLFISALKRTTKTHKKRTEREYPKLVRET